MKLNPKTLQFFFRRVFFEAFHLEIFVNDTIGALDRTVSITMEDPSGHGPGAWG